MLEAVIFDMDGVIVDSEPFWKLAEKDTFTALGVEVNEELTQFTQKMTTQEVTRFWFEQFPWKGKTHEEVEQMVITRVVELIEQQNCVFPGIQHFVQSLKNKNILTGLATNSPASIIPVVLQKSGLSTLFNTISSAEFEPKGKPHPDIYLNTAKRLEVAPEKCIVIEDSDSGITAAKRAGMKVIQHTNDLQNPKHPLADFFLDNYHPDQLAELNTFLN